MSETKTTTKTKPVKVLLEAPCAFVWDSITYRMGAIIEIPVAVYERFQGLFDVIPEEPEEPEEPHITEEGPDDPDGLDEGPDDDPPEDQE